MSLTILIVVIGVILVSSVKILNEYERGVIFRLGRAIGYKGPGIIFVIPGIDKMVKISLRTVVLDVPPQDVITRDNVTVKVNAVVYFRVMDPRLAVVEVEDYADIVLTPSVTQLNNDLFKEIRMSVYPK